MKQIKLQTLQKSQIAKSHLHFDEANVTLAMRWYLKIILVSFRNDLIAKNSKLRVVEYMREELVALIKHSSLNRMENLNGSWRRRTTEVQIGIIQMETIDMEFLIDEIQAYFRYSFRKQSCMRSLQNVLEAWTHEIRSRRHLRGREYARMPSDVTRMCIKGAAGTRLARSFPCMIRGRMALPLSSPSSPQTVFPCACCFPQFPLLFLFLSYYPSFISRTCRNIPSLYSATS